MAGSTTNDYTSHVSECAICLQSMLGQSPRILPCWHSFCESCIRHLAAYEGHNRVKCPTCRSVHRVPNGGVGRFPANFYIEQIEESQNRLRSSQQTSTDAGGAARCQTCAQHGVETQPEYRCLQCDRRFCQGCRDHHVAIPACRSHTLQFIGQEQTPMMKCNEHDTVATYFCRRCLLPLCVDCMMSDQHRFHNGDIEELSDAVRSERASMTNLFDQMENLVSKVGTAISRAENRSNLEMTEDMIKRHMEAAKKRVEMEGEALIRELRDAYPDIKESKVSELKDTNSQAREVLEDVEYILGANEQKFLSELKGLKPRARATLTLLAQLPADLKNNVIFLPAKPLSSGRLVGTMETDGAVKRESWEPPHRPALSPPVIPPRRSKSFHQNRFSFNIS